MKKIMIILALSAMLVIAACAPSEPEPIGQEPLDPIIGVDDGMQEQVQLPEVVATVNGEDVLGFEVTSMQNEFLAQGQQVSVEDALNQILLVRVLSQEAENRDYDVTEDTVAQNFEMQGISMEEVKSIIEEQGIEYDSFILEQVRNLKLQRLFEEKIEQVEVSTQEAQEFFDSQSEMLGENATFEDLEGDIKSFIASQRADELILELGNDLLSASDVQLYI